MTEDENNKMLAFVIIGIATLGLIFFIVNWIRCRMSRTHEEEYEHEEMRQIRIKQ